MIAAFTPIVRYDTSGMDERRVILLVGPTGVGKTGAALALARLMGTEVVGADSMQIYRGMDIGTEKPSPGQLGGVRHHMIDVADPREDYSVGRYLDAVRPLIDALHARGLVPVVTGGTGLYVKALTRGLCEAPEADWELREELLREPSEGLHARLSALDPEAASAIMPGDRRRLVRALEVVLLTGRPLTRIQKEETAPLPYAFVKVALTRERAELYRMIDGRVGRMVERGLLDEVRRLMEIGPGRTPLQAIGYREIAAHLRGEIAIEEAVRLIQRNTRRYAKRQYTWFRKEPALQWVDITGLADPEAILARILPALSETLRSLSQKFSGRV
jgi:tRNA dimethylallyltransferase